MLDSLLLTTISREYWVGLNNTKLQKQHWTAEHYNVKLTMCVMLDLPLHTVLEKTVVIRKSWENNKFKTVTLFNDNKPVISDRIVISISAKITVFSPLLFISLTRFKYEMHINDKYVILVSPFRPFGFSCLLFEIFCCSQLIRFFFLKLVF